MEDKNKKYKYALPVGKTILTGGKYPYHIEKVLGQGGFGITYLASTTIEIGTTNHKVFFAIKEFFSQDAKCYREKDGTRMLYSPAASQEVEEGIKDFVKEAERLSRIFEHNENIVHVYEVFKDNGTAYYVMEHLDGSNLREICLRQKAKCLSETEAIAIIRPIIKAVSYIHEEHQLLHLDIKPENIMMCGKKPVLIDFGSTLHFNKKGNLTSTKKSSYATVGFAPREQRLDPGITHFSPEADVYALAATLYYLLVGKTPLVDITPEYIQKELEGKGVSERVCKAIMHGMEADKNIRTQTAAAFLEELEQEKTMPNDSPLPSNYVIHLGSMGYRIIRTIERGEYYIKYETVRYSAPGYNGANHTVKKTYPLYEYFVQGVHERQKDNSVVEKESNPNLLERFSALAFKQIGEQISITYKPNSNLYRTNGTLYFVEEKKPAPPTPIWKYIKIGAMVIGLIMTIVLINEIYHSCSENKQEVGPVEDLIADEPVDSVEMPVQIVSPSKSEDPQQSSTTEKKEPSNANPVELTNEDKYQLSKTQNDWTAMTSLARKGYKPACGALAKHYIEIDGNLAKEWALKSSADDKLFVLKQLRNNGFLTINACEKMLNNGQISKEQYEILTELDY